MHVLGVREETVLPYKGNGSRDDRPVIGASPWRYRTPRCEPTSEPGPGIVGDSGERREPHPV